jgi:hypothetical protein
MRGKQIDNYNCIAVEACIFVEVGTAIKDLEAMKIPVMEELFYNKYVCIVRTIPDERFARIELCSSMLEIMGEQSLTPDTVCCVSIRLIWSDS